MPAEKVAAPGKAMRQAKTIAGNDTLKQGAGDSLAVVIGQTLVIMRPKFFWN